MILKTELCMEKYLTNIYLFSHHLELLHLVKDQVMIIQTLNLYAPGSVADSRHYRLSLYHDCILE